MNAKVRPCKHSALPDGSPIECGRPCMKGKQSCIWHWIAKQPADVQQRAATQRMELYLSDGSQGRDRVPPSEWPPGERWCAGCQSFVPLFYCRGSRCKSCASSASHGARVLKTYGITSERYDELLEQQGGRCAVCGNRPRTQRLAVDHHHVTGEPRGLLCKRCNHDLLGGGHDDPKLLWRALSYLLFPPASYPDRSKITPNVVVAQYIRVASLSLMRQGPVSKLPEDPDF